MTVSSTMDHDQLTPTFSCMNLRIQKKKSLSGPKKSCMAGYTTVRCLAITRRALLDTRPPQTLLDEGPPTRQRAHPSRRHIAPAPSAERKGFAAPPGHIRRS
jgi:hypothetical protein